MAGHVMFEQDERVFGLLYAGNVEYDKAAASVEIDVLIAALEEAREDGVTHIVGLSGNYRGPSYVRLGSSIDSDYEDER